MSELELRCSDDLIGAALRLGATRVGPWSESESALAACRIPRSWRRQAADLPGLKRMRASIMEGEDPLGRAYIELRMPAERRSVGATYTPAPIVGSMLGWARAQCNPQRVVDPGVGSGRFLMRAAELFPAARLVGIEIDPLAALLARANLAVIGAAERTRILVGDFRHMRLRSAQRTLYVGNPPYVRHHAIDAAAKNWLADAARQLGLECSRLAGLHVHFFLATLCSASAGDCGVFVTAAEWLDVNYGKTLRQAFIGPLGGQAIVLVDPKAAPFPDAQSTAAITLFKVGSCAPSIRMKCLKRLDAVTDLHGGRKVRRERLGNETRWTRLARAVLPRPGGYIELGELCRVHRGQATGANDVWIAGKLAQNLPPAVLFPAITRARELIAAGAELRDLDSLRRVVDLPADLDELASSDRRLIARFLRYARRRGVQAGYLARHRRAWWSVGLGPAAPILATYMARGAPRFSRNCIGARHLNIAHGLYPRQPLSETQLRALVAYLRDGVNARDGRSYAGGLVKFEPGEMERLAVPGPELLGRSEALTAAGSGRSSRRR